MKGKHLDRASVLLAPTQFYYLELELG
jgi:hypothetical protein